MLTAVLFLFMSILYKELFSPYTSFSKNYRLFCEDALSPFYANCRFSPANNSPVVVSVCFKYNEKHKTNTHPSRGIKGCYSSCLVIFREGISIGRQSTKENKTIYQVFREEAGLTRSEAQDLMTAVSDSKIEKFEYETQEPTPYDIVQMADAYKRPDLCNYYCSHKCEIGHRYVPEVKITDLSNIILETIASLNEINPLTSRLVQIARDGKITDDEIKDFALISKKLDEISLAVDSLNLWVDKTAGEQGLNAELLHAEKEKLK